MGKNGMILCDRPKPTAGCSANGRRRWAYGCLKHVEKRNK